MNKIIFALAYTTKPITILKSVGKRQLCFADIFIILESYGSIDDCF
jgi:hypothetical protein